MSLIIIAFQPNNVCSDTLGLRNSFFSEAEEILTMLLSVLYPRLLHPFSDSKSSSTNLSG